jgi:type IV secretory pathway VirB2 component (pilin)
VTLLLGTRPARRLGAALVAFGVVGLVLVAAAVVMLLAAGPSLDELGAVSERAGPTRQALADAQRTLDDLSKSADALEGTLASSRTSLADAAVASRSLADALTGVSAAMGIEILGNRPFAGVGQGLGTASDGVRRVADDLTALGERLGTHAGDAHRIAGDAAALRDSVQRIDASLQGPPGFGLAGSVAVVRLVLMGLLAWLGVLAGACVLVGRRLHTSGWPAAPVAP